MSNNNNQRQQIRHQSLQSSDDPPEEYNAGLKINKKKSRYTSNREAKEKFEERATKTYEDDQEIKTKAFELSRKFVSLLKDQTLLENKSPIQKDLEGDISRQIVDIALALNNDDQKPEGIGSAGCIMLLLRCLLTQRDAINKISYDMNLVKKELADIKSSSETGRHE